MGKKSKSKTKQKKAAKKVLKKQKKPSGLKNASKLAKQADSQGIDLVSLASSAVGSIPFVGGLASNLIDQGASMAGGGVSSGRGGARGVQLIDSTGLNLGTISRRKALLMLVNRGKRPPRRSKPTFIQVPQGQQLVKV